MVRVARAVCRKIKGYPWYEWVKPFKWEEEKRMTIDCIADLHGNCPELSGGDLLIVAGDLTARHSSEEHAKVMKWLWEQEYKKIILIAGNHDSYIEQIGELYLDEYDTSGKITYLCDSGTEFQGYKIWGSPWTPWFCGVNPSCKAFMSSEEDITKKWEKIPKDTDILVTHGPPWGILDCTEEGDEYLGCKHLRQRVVEIMPKLHVFGHIHGGYGKTLLKGHGLDTICVNASVVDEGYIHVNKPIRIQL